MLRRVQLEHDGHAYEATVRNMSATGALVEGLWNGIASMGSWLYSQISGWIKSVVPGPVLKVLGISSP